MSAEMKYIQIPHVLAVLSYDGDYHYIDRLAYSNSKALALYYLREAVRSFNALKRSPPKDIPSEVKELMNNIDSRYLEIEVENMHRIEKTQELREILSLICTKALATASKFIKQGE